MIIIGAYLLVLIDFADEFLVRLLRVQRGDVYVLLHVVHVATQTLDLEHIITINSMQYAAVSE
jgi:hypothetical protein